MESELGISLLILALLFFFLVYGSGSYSVDEFMRKHKKYLKRDSFNQK